MSGYDLRQIIDGSISNFWSESYGRIYPMLAQLEEEGLTSCARTRSDGGRPRNVYSLTPAGRAALDEWLADPVAASQPPREERLLKLFFSARVRPALSIQLVEAFELELAETQSRYSETRERIQAIKDAPIDQRYWLMTLRYGELRLEAELSWCAEVLAELRALRSD